MNDNFPPIPPEPLYPGAQVPEGYGPPQSAPQHPASQTYPQQAPQPYFQQPQPQPFAAYPQQPHGMHGVYAKATRGWDPHRPKSSGFRVAAGIVGIACGLWFLVPSIAGFQKEGGVVFVAFLVLVAALGNITAGIILLAQQRQRRRGAPVTSLSFAGLTLLLGLIGSAVPYYGAALLLSAVVLAGPVLIVMGLGLSRERRNF